MRKKIILILSSEKLAEIWRFAVTGGISFLIDYGLLYVLTEYASLNYLFSSAISFTVSVIINYFICVFWVFENSQGSGIKAKILFVGSSVVGLGLNQLFMWLMADLFKIYYMLAKIISTVVVMIWNYIMKRKALYL